MKNTFNKNHILLWITIFFSSVAILSCSDWDEYKKYTKDGEVSYTGKFDTLIIYPGMNRVRVYGRLMADPKIVKCKIFWNNKADSVEYDIDQETNNRIFDKTFSVDEGVKSFTVFTYDAFGNSSVAVSAIGASYGARYRNKVVARKLKSLNYYAPGAIMEWDLIDQTIGVGYNEIRYTTVSGNDTIVLAPISQPLTILRNLRTQPESNLTYRTVFKPELTSIDTFSTPIITQGVFNTATELELFRGLFKASPLLGDSPPNGGGSGGIASMWDGKPNGYANSSFTDVSAASNQTKPSIITFDLGILTKLSKVWILPFKDATWYSFTTMKRFEIWGSANPNPDGSLDASWHLMVSDTVVRPSDRAEGQPDTPEDIAAASAGFNWPLDINAPKVRYLRIRCLESFRKNYTAQSVGEIKVYGPVPQ